MKTLNRKINLKTLINDTHMYDYLRISLKPFNLLEVKVLFIGGLASVSTLFTTYAEDYFGISGRFAFMLLVALLSDFITGILATKVNKGKITSKKGRRTIYKTGFYLIFIYIAYSLHLELSPKSELLHSILKYLHIFILIHITLWEAISIDENLIKMGVNLGITDFLKGAYYGIKNVFINISKKQQ